MCRWRLREALFGYGLPAPEPWSAAMQRRLLWWGYLSWLWRAALFFGIALAVYHLFFKLLGIFLMLVELGWFIFLPIFKECRHWWSHREQAYAPRVLISAAGLLALLLLLIVPWHSSFACRIWGWGSTFRTPCTTWLKSSARPLARWSLISGTTRFACCIWRSFRQRVARGMAVTLCKACSRPPSRYAARSQRWSGPTTPMRASIIWRWGLRFRNGTWQPNG
ncbi:membrane component KefB [Pseudomonas syringae pv. actinidiae]|uniref:Membrane component KefB n=1 Tax=Pseudomonas syringae pv. actinidiae TaxID=103796 RepID=A0A2V0QHI1_PSESF|nr:membrane component KefB [Pseudomonas syringae pv. actinidiae]